MNKIIVIEGTDCSGKETQSKKLIERFKQDGIHISYVSFPAYDTPTGKIVGGPYLGKPSICEGYFMEGASKVDPKVSSLYYAADRLYNLPKIYELLQEGPVILDRYTYSNMAHQGGKEYDKEKRNELYEWIEELEFNLLKLPQADIKLFLHMPYRQACELKKNRTELDQLEMCKEHLINAEKAYLEVANKYGFKTIECVNGEKIKTIEEISDEAYSYVKKLLK